MTDSIVLASGNIEVYQSEIDILCDEYISSLPDGNMIYKSTVFSGMLNYIYQHKLKYIIKADKDINNINQYYNNYKFLDDIFYNVYVNLCTKYNITPSIIQFCVLTDVNREILGDIAKGVFRANGSKANPENSRTVKKWYNTCESMLLSKATNESSIGSIFALKANYGYREAPQQLEVLTGSEQTATPEQIAERYKDTAKPSLPDLES